MKRGEIWWVDFDPSIGEEIQKKRPAVIVSNDSSNKNLNRVQVVPLTSNTERVYSSESLVLFENKNSKAMAHQLATVSKNRLSKYSGKITDDELTHLEKAIKIQLNIQ
jgi:mRNA interferase MazF